MSSSHNLGIDTYKTKTSLTPLYKQEKALYNNMLHYIIFIYNIAFIHDKNINKSLMKSYYPQNMWPKLS